VGRFSVALGEMRTDRELTRPNFDLSLAVDDRTRLTLSSHQAEKLAALCQGMGHLVEKYLERNRSVKEV
jgi:hypothetical protein